MRSKLDFKIGSRMSLGVTCLLLKCLRCRGGVTLNQASLGNVGTCRPDAKGETQVEDPRG
jgi:hypothetical protein